MFDNRLRKNDKLLKTAEFLAARTGQKFENRYFLAYFLSCETPKIKLGITVSKKVGNAVTRGHIKRLTREAFRTWHFRHLNGGGLNIIARGYAQSASNKDLFKALEDIFGKIERTFKT